MKELMFPARRLNVIFWFVIVLKNNAANKLSAGQFNRTIIIIIVICVFFLMLKHNIIIYYMCG